MEETKLVSQTKSWEMDGGNWREEREREGEKWDGRAGKEDIIVNRCFPFFFGFHKNRIFKPLYQNTHFFKYFLLPNVNFV